MAVGMFLGRFQPFHNGHLAVVKKMLEECESGLLVIGSANVPPNSDNPYSAFERRYMVEIALREAKLLDKCEIFMVEDIPDDSKWVAHVESHLPEFSHVYAGEGLHFDLFRDSNKYEMVELPRLYDIHATTIRDRIISGENWEELVPRRVADEVRKMGLWRISGSRS